MNENKIVSVTQIIFELQFIFHKRIQFMQINPAPSCRGIAPRRKAILSHSSPQQAAGDSGRCWIKPETLEKLRVILKNEFGQEAKDQDLHDIAFNLVGFYDALMRFYC